MASFFARDCSSSNLHTEKITDICLRDPQSNTIIHLSGVDYKYLFGLSKAKFTGK